MSGEVHDRDCERVLTDSGFVFIDCLCSLRRAQAAAWSEGYRHGVEDMTGTETLTVVRRNPYRVPSTSEGEGT